MELRKVLMKSVILLLSLSLEIIHAQHARTQSVILHDVNEGSFLSSYEDLPPRHEWFRVRNNISRRPGPVHPSRSYNLQPFPKLPQQIVNGGRNLLPVNRPQYEVTPSVQSTNEVNAPKPHFTVPTIRTTSSRPPVQIHVNNRGRVGFQNSRGRKETGNENDDELHIPPPEEWDEVTHTPPLSSLPPSITNSSRPQNYHLHIRHENGHRYGSATNSSGGVYVSNVNNNQQQYQRYGVPSSQIHLEEFPQLNLRTTSKPSTYISNADSGNSYNDYRNRDRGSYVRPVAFQSNSPNPQRVVNFRPNAGESNDINFGYSNRQNTGQNNPPPPHDQVARMARYIVRSSNWTSVATISTMSTVRGFPFSNIFSVSDGTITNSSGIPYMYLTPLDMSAIDLEGNTKASMSMTLAQGDYCRVQQYDPEDPRCARVILVGNIVPVQQSTEINFARTALYSKHPDMASWPKDHGWYFAKMNIERIIVLDYFGGAKTVTLNDYFNSRL